MNPAPSRPVEFYRRLRERFLERGMIAEPDLLRAGRLAEERKRSLEEILISMGLLTEDQWGAVLAEELSVPYVFPYPSLVDRSLMARFPADLLRARRAVPLAREEDQIVVATSEPATLEARPDFESACGERVAFALASSRQVERTLEALFGPSRDSQSARRPADDLGAVTLLYGHLAGALAARANEVRFEPLEGALVVRYRVESRLEDRAREPLASLLPLISRARILVGACKGARPYDTFGTLEASLGGRELRLDIAIVPTRLGESVLIKLSTREAPRAEPRPPKIEASAAPPPSLKADIGTLLLFTKEAGASDLHLSAGAPPMVRVHGEMRKLTLPDGREAGAYSADETRSMVFEILEDSQKARLEAEKELDFALSIGKDTRFRGNVFYQDRGLAAVFRVIPTVIKSCDELGLPPAIKGMAELEKGLVLCTGPTGSGKSTTLAAIVDLINSTRRGHILTIEDPIEFVHPSKMCMVNQREVGRNTKAFANALRSALREDPDVILVGEMRDLETIALAITAAETGHLVFGTLHTSSAAKTVDRIINVFPAGEQAQVRAMLSESLEAVIAQVLLQRKGGKGRAAAQEILIASSGVRSMIREGKTYQIPSAIQTGAKYGMQSLEQALMKLAVNGVIDATEAERQLAALGLTREEAAETKLQATLGGGGMTRGATPSQPSPPAQALPGRPRTY